MKNFNLTKDAFQILNAKIGVVTNNETLIKKSEFHFIETNFYKLHQLGYTTNVDTTLYIIDDPDSEPFIQTEQDDTILVGGDLSGLNNRMTDKRYNLFGNLGLFTRFVLHTLETRHGIYSYHAAGIYAPDTNEFIIILGGAGSGKTTFLLRAIQEGFQIFGTELVHFKIVPSDSGNENTVEFYKGALLDNIRYGTLKYDYPEALKKLGITLDETDDEWDDQVWEANLSDFSPQSDTITNPNLRIIIPHVERNWDTMTKHELKNERAIQKILFDNISEKVSRPFVLFEEIPLPGFGSKTSLYKRLDNVKNFYKYGNFNKIAKVTASTQETIKEIIR